MTSEAEPTTPASATEPGACPSCGGERHYEEPEGGGVDTVCSTCGRRGAGDDLKEYVVSPAAEPGEPEWLVAMRDRAKERRFALDDLPHLTTLLNEHASARSQVARLEAELGEQGRALASVCLPGESRVDCIIRLIRERDETQREWEILRGWQECVRAALEGEEDGADANIFETIRRIVRERDIAHSHIRAATQPQSEPAETCSECERLYGLMRDFASAGRALADAKYAAGRANAELRDAEAASGRVVTALYAEAALHPATATNQPPAGAEQAEVKDV